MKKYQKILLITSACLVVGGGIMGVAGFAMGGRPGFLITKEGVQTAEDMELSKFVEKKVSLKGVSSLIIDCMEGDIEIVEGDDFHVEYGYDEKYLNIKEEKKNGKWYFKETYVRKIELSGIHFFWGTDTWKEQDSYLRIYIPKGTKLSELNLVNGYGKVKMELPKTEVEYTKLTLESGNLEMKGLNSQTAELNLEYGDLKMEECDFSGLTMKTESGKCSLIDTKAEELELESDYGDVSMSQVNAGTVAIKGESGNVTLEEVTGQMLTVYSEYGNIVLNTVTMDKSVHLEEESGCVQINRVKTGQMDVVNENGNVEGKEVEIAGGDIELDYGECDLAQLSAEDIKVTNESGGIRLGMTGKEEEYNMSLKTEYGEISINGENRGSDITLERDKAGNRLNLSSESGNITVKTQ